MARRAWFLILSFLCVSPAFAVAYQAATYPSIQQINGANLLKLASVPPAANGGYRIPSIVNVAGRAITVPATARVAANAATVALSMARYSTPLGIGTGILAWLALSNITPDQQQQGWVSPPSGPYLDYTGRPLNDPLVRGPDGWNCEGGYNCFGQIGECPSNSVKVPFSGGVCMYEPYRSRGCMQMYCESIPGFVPPNPGGEANWNQNPQPLTDNAISDLITNPNFGLAVDSPVIDPSVVAVDEPYQNASGQWLQPMARITPASSGRAAVDLYDQPVTSGSTSPGGGVGSANPIGVAEPVAGSSPVDYPEVDPSASASADFCKANPTAAACAELGQDTDAPEIPRSTFDFSINPVADPLGGGSCPGSIAILGQSISYQPACDAMTSIRPFILAFAWLMAGYILIGAVKET